MSLLLRFLIKRRKPPNEIRNRVKLVAFFAKTKKVEAKF